MPSVFLGLGSNQGDRIASLRSAVAAFRSSSDMKVIRVSAVYETEAHTRRPGESQEAYLNAVVHVETILSPEDTLTFARELERSAGRRPDRQRWDPRPLDIDLLAYDAEIRSDDDLTLPHPRLANRRFVLQPWADIAPNFVVPPPFDESVRTLLDRCPDTAEVRRTDRSLEPSST